MSFSKYPAYKDSGVQWLGEVPEHWFVDRLKYACKVFPSNVDKKSYDNETPVRLCNYTDVYYNETIVAGMDFMAATATSEQIEKFTLRAGDTIITKDSETADDIAIAAYVPEDLPGTICGYHLSMVRPNEATHGAFVKRLFDSHYARGKFNVLANGLTRVGLGQYALDNVDFPWPPFTEQQAIASFLDRETAKIDVLVAEQEKLVALLKEKRQSVISHAITQGLDPSVPMKDSGVEWLGVVPAHWEVVPLNALSSIIQTGPFGSQLHSEEYVEDQTPVINPSNIIDGRLAPDMSCTVTNEIVLRLEHHRLEVGDIVVGRRGEMGRCAVVGSEAVGWLCGTGSLKIRLKKEISPQYVGTFLRTNYVRERLSLDSVGSTMENLNTSILGNIRVPSPPTNEQHEIDRFIVNQTAKLDALTTEAQSAIALLQERRTALISAAVTGQIDVRQHPL